MSYSPHDFPEDPANPYAPPSSDIGRPLPVEYGAPDQVPFTVGDIFARAYEIYKERMGICIGAVCGSLGINYLYNLLQQFVPLGLARAGLGQALTLLITVVLVAGGVILQFYLTIGQMLVLLKIAKRRPAEFGEVFSGGPYILRWVLASLLVGLMVMGIIIVCLIPTGIAAIAAQGNTPVISVAAGVGGVVALAVVLILTIRLSQYGYLIIDRDASSVDALRISGEITRGKGGTIVLVWLLSGLINLGGLLALCFGLVFTIPFTMLVSAVMYRSLAGGVAPQQLDADDFLPEREMKPLTDADFGDYP